MIKSNAFKGLILSGVAYLALWLLVPRATFLGWLAKSSYNTTATGVGLILPGIVHGLSVGLPMVAFMAAQIAGIYYFTRLGLKWWGYLLCMIGSIALVGILLTLVIHTYNIPGQLGRYPTLQEHMIILGRYYGPYKLPISLAFITAASGLGGLVSFRVKDKNLLLPVSMFAAVIDFWTVNYGFVGVAMTKTPEIVSAVSVPIPHAGTGVFMPNTMIGPGDFLFMALLFAAVSRLELDGMRNYWYVFAAMSIGMMSVMFDLLPFLPALTVLAVGIVLANYREFKLTKQEKISVAIVAVVLAVSVPIVRSMVSQLQRTESTPTKSAPHSTTGVPKK